MRIQLQSSARTAGAATGSLSRRVMWINADRVLYVGLLGEPSVRCLGALSIYLSLHQPHRIRVGEGAWEQTCMSVVPPHVPHRIVATERMICNMSIEPETVDTQALPGYLRTVRGAVPAHGITQDMRGALVRVLDGGLDGFSCTADFDRAFFGAALPARVMDRRVRAVIERIKNDPNGHISGQECADAAHLSVSRFLHLFKSEAGSSFRSFRSWQRARCLLYHVKREASLVNIALDAGYPDSTHFSHSIRQFYGLTPKSIFAGSRNLTLYGGGAAGALGHAFN
ncbi:MAG: AraC family transcriptional regulator [Desulfovibrionaceae bacterium]|nr:AraC family transcriptional regulator [Desulfovibrionaceae bacterium]